MFGLIANIAGKTVCASASAFTSGILIGKKIGQTIKGK